MGAGVMWESLLKLGLIFTVHCLLIGLIVWANSFGEWVGVVVAVAIFWCIFLGGD